MQSLAGTARVHNLSLLSENQFDVLVIGGGITGAGVALDAAARGYRVALVEKADFASGTSSKSTKLVHGGIRYLPNFDIDLVHEALVERGLLLQNAPFLVTPIGFVLPIYKGERHPVGMPFTTPGGIGLSAVLNLGLWMYDRLAGKRNIRKHRRLSRKEVLELAPPLVQKGLQEGFIYYDAQTNDARLTLTLLRTAAHHGAVIANYVEVTSFLLEQGKVSGAYVHDHLDGQEFTIRARHVVNATGVFSEGVERLTGVEPQVRIEPSKGVHLVLSRADLKLGEDAIVLPETEDGRILFLVPWQSRAIFGTTDTRADDLDHPVPAQQDIAYLLKYLNRYLAINLSAEDIISTYAGYRPLVKPHASKASTAKLSRSHVVLQNASGLVSIVGGKLTTYRRMAQDTVDVLSRRDGRKPIHLTQDLPLQGGMNWASVQPTLERRGETLGIPSPILKHLGRSYGSEANELLNLIEHDSSLATQLIADLPYIRAEVIYACRYEMAMKPADILARRTAIILEDRQGGLGIVDEVAALMGQEYGWSLAQQTTLVQEYHKGAKPETSDI
jgi:glycerol-3-phosphate dehydrogenase